MLHWGLTAAALLLFVFAVRTIFLSSQGEEDKGRQKLGCGFAVVAAALWIYVLDHWLDDASGAIRIGIGVLLVLPSVRAIARPRGAPILGAAVALVLAVVIAGPQVRALWQQHGLDFRPAEQRELENRIEEVERLRVEYGERRSQLETLRNELRAEIGGAAKSWSDVEKDPELLDRLRLLKHVEEELETADGALSTIAAYLPEMRAELDALEKKEAGAPPSDAAKLDALREELRDAPPIEALPLGEQYERKQELQELFEREF